VTPYPTWARKAATNPAGLHTLVRETVTDGGAAVRGPNNTLERLQAEGCAARTAKGAGPC